jgi:hypothetical protein
MEEWRSEYTGGGGKESEGSCVAPLILDAQYLKGLLLYSR